MYADTLRTVAGRLRNLSTGPWTWNNLRSDGLLTRITQEFSTRTGDDGSTEYWNPHLPGLVLRTDPRGGSGSVRWSATLNDGAATVVATWLEHFADQLEIHTLTGTDRNLAADLSNLLGEV